MKKSTDTVKFCKLDEAAIIPNRAHASDAGYDLYSLEHVVIPPGGRARVKTGVALELPNAGVVGMVCPRSGLAIKTGVTVLNAPGIVDSGYRGDVSVLLANLDPVMTAEINPGDRIAQLLIVALCNAEAVEVDTITATDRGASGFGSTGV